MAADKYLSGPDLAARRDAIAQAALATVFAALMFFVKSTLRTLETDSALRWALVALPGVLLIAWAWVVARGIRQADEMMQALYVRAAAIAGGTLLTAATVWGLFVSLLGAPDFPAFLLLPAFSLLFGVVLTVLRARGGQ
jgi:O-antigen/teichoic acid export membrane protein